MIPARRLPWRGVTVPDARPTALPPVTLTGPVLVLARVFWIVMAAGALALWILEAPSYYRAALHLHRTSGQVGLSRAELLAGLDGLGLSPTIYAVQSITSLSLMAGSMYVAGLLIFLRRSDRWIAFLVSVCFVTLGSAIMNAYGGLTFAEAHPWLKGPADAYLTLTNASYYALFLIPLLFPDGRFVPRWTGWAAGLLILLLVAGSIEPGSAVDMQRWPPALAVPFNVVWFGTALLAPVYRYRRVSDPVQRAQTKWVMLGLIVGIGAFLGVSLLQVCIPWLTATPERAVLFHLEGTSLTFLALSFLPVSFAIAILRFRLWDIDLILNRALVYGSLTVSVIGLYVLVVAGLGGLLSAGGNPALTLVATALVAVIFHPLHQRLQRGVNRLLYGHRDDPYTVLSRLGRQLERTPAPDAILPSIVQTVAETLRLPYVALTLLQDGEYVIAASAGQAIAAPPVHLPLVYQGETIGQLILATRPGEEAFSASERHLLDDLARQAGIAAYATRLTADLRRSRERLVSAREEERRRLRRDLHDGLGPALASVTLMADAAHNLLTHDPHAASSLLQDLKREAQAATGEVRRVVYQLRPPALDELGLVSALREQAAQYSTSGLRITVEAPESLPLLPAAVEVAAYRIVQEALTNVVRHAQARNCTVRIAVLGSLDIEITDDGTGLRRARPGVGLASMRERAEELGGECAVQSHGEGGTRVRAVLPLGETS